MTPRPDNLRRTWGVLLLAVFLPGAWFLPAAHEVLEIHLPAVSSRDLPPGENGEQPVHDPDNCLLCEIKALPLEAAPAAAPPENCRPLPERLVYLTARPRPGPGAPLYLSRAPPFRQPSAA